MDSVKDTDKEKNVSCFALDGVVAEMVIEVEDNPKPGFEESSFSPSKNSNNPGENVDSEEKREDEVITLEEVPCEKEQEEVIPKISPQLSETLQSLAADSSETIQPSTTDSSETIQPSKTDSSETIQPLTNDSSETIQLTTTDSSETIQPSTMDSSDTIQPSITDSTDINQPLIPETSEPKLDDKQVNDEKVANQEKKVQNIKKVIKRRHKVSSNQIHNETSGIARYPGRKRQANKRYISDEMVTSTANKSESSLSKETHKGEKRRKLNAKDETNEKIVSQRKSSASSNDYDSNSAKVEPIKTRNELAAKVKREYPEVPEEKVEDEPKHKTLRKLPFRKNKDAPEVPDFTPKVIWWNGVGEGVGAKLGDLPEVKSRIQGAKSVRALYRVLFYQWPTNGQDLIGQILEFNGFPFDRTSYEFTKRQSLMKIMLDVTIANVCDILGVKKGSNKNTMISNILNFLLRPYGKIDPALDRSLQPVVLLERIEFDHNYFPNSSGRLVLRRQRGRPKGKLARREMPPAAPSLRTTRNTRREGSETSVDKKISLDENLKASKAKPSPSKETDALDTKRRKLSTTDSVKDVKDNKPKAEVESTEGATKSTNEDESTSNKKTAVKITKRMRKKKKKLKPGNKIKVEKPSENPTENRDVSMDFEIEDDDNAGEMEEEPSKSVPNEKDKLSEESKEDQPVNTPDNVINEISPDSSETESAEETRLITASASTSKSSPKSPQMRRGKPLKMFPQISDSIKYANFAALQRLHILLFGAADKAENLKVNILAFGGFPFLEGSDEWKQKHFLLSLLAQNNLREYLKLLCIEFSNDDQPAMINKLMRFLACPSEAALGKKPLEKQTEVGAAGVKRKEIDSSQPKKNKLETKKKNVKKKEEKKHNRHRKVLMSEEEARRLEASFAREQRAIARDHKAPPPIKREPAPPPVEQYSSMKPIVPPRPPMADPKQLNALLQTVYKRRALKAAGAVISTPNKGEKNQVGRHRK